MRLYRLVALAALIAGAGFASACRAGTFTRLYTFSGGSDGGLPGTLISNGHGLYGFAGTGGDGNVFKFDPATKKLRLLHAFKGGNDGKAPSSLLLQAGKLYGTTYYGGGSGCQENGGYGCGTIFALDPNTGVETILYSFPNSLDGNSTNPGGLIYNHDALYGVTYSDGPNYAGSIFELNLNTGNETTLYYFVGGSDGANPNPYLLSRNGLLYGTTSGGGGNCTKNIECGTLFTFNLATGAEAILHSFTPITDGSAPGTNLIYRKGLLYGGTVYGGDMSCGRGGCGTAFSIDPATGVENVVSTFVSNQQRFAGLADHGAALYETLRQGSLRYRDKAYGELVKLDLKTNHRSVLHKFDNTDGAYPEAPLTYSDGAFYGTTTEGGNNGCYNNEGCGTIFSYVP